MKIVLVNSYYYPIILGGAEYSVKKLAEVLVKNHHEVIVICADNKNSIEFINGVKIYRMKVHNLISVNKNKKHNKVIMKMHRLLDFCNIFNYKMFKNVLVSEKPDLIHTNGLYEITPIVWIVARKLRIPIVHTLRDYYLLCRHVNMRHIQDNSECKAPSWGCKIYRLINKFLCGKVNAVTAPSKVTINCFLKAGFFRNIEHAVIENATEFDMEKLVALKKQRLNKSRTDEITFVFLGTLSENKGILWLLDTFNKITDKRFKLKIAGKGPLEKYVVEFCKKHENVEFLGFLGAEELNTLLYNSDVLICPSMWEEPFGRVILDAYCALMPVIVSDMGALPSLVVEGVTGSVVKHGDVEELEKAIRIYSSDNSSLFCYDSIIKQLEKYSIDYQVKAFTDLYKNIITGDKS
ncbi:glycosyltransferase family 4 protein [Clostridium omnivorum]|uniref:LPS biosynthesis RfbU related protein n=1 Tax=Clostridium omnivorum TaxID=1604902 RepID=A0ABQ5N3J1_9CLOT|nr:glycosyltransferase family 4 protein [Clostridium sp. E14]GLC29709.1 LPS biosynthesis RfbU related protein [Clostridium sp. E14]